VCDALCVSRGSSWLLPSRKGAAVWAVSAPSSTRPGRVLGCRGAAPVPGTRGWHLQGGLPRTSACRGCACLKKPYSSPRDRFRSWALKICSLWLQGILCVVLWWENIDRNLDFYLPGPTGCVCVCISHILAVPHHCPLPLNPLTPTPGIPALVLSCSVAVMDAAVIPCLDFFFYLFLLYLFLNISALSFF